jgi:hypothetical protein
MAFQGHKKHFMAIGASAALVVAVAAAAVVATTATATGKPKPAAAPTSTPKQGATTTTSTTTAPVPHTFEIGVVGCPQVRLPSTSVGGPYGAPFAGPFVVGSALSRDAVYSPTSSDALSVAAPTGWKCLYNISGGDENLVAVAPTAGQLPDDAPVQIVNDYLGTQAGAGVAEACSVFSTPALVQWVKAVAPSQTCALPAGRTVTGDDHTTSFVDTDGTRGAGILILPTSATSDDGTINVLTCKPVDGLTFDHCQAIVDDFVARNRAAEGPPPPIRLPASTEMVTTSGRIGLLQMGMSTEADVRAAEGVPGAISTGNVGAGPTYPDYEALGYDCRSKTVHDITTCGTVFYINSKTGTLAGFTTSSSKYATERGTTVGMTEAQAGTNERQPEESGCLDGIWVNGKAWDEAPGIIFLDVEGKATDRVRQLTMDWAPNSVGVLFC